MDKYKDTTTDAKGIAASVIGFLNQIYKICAFRNSLFCGIAQVTLFGQYKYFMRSYFILLICLRTIKEVWTHGSWWSDRCRLSLVVTNLTILIIINLHTLTGFSGYTRAVNNNLVFKYQNCSEVSLDIFHSNTALPLPLATSHPHQTISASRKIS